MQKKIILLTGSTSGIGKATAFELGRNGYNLILTGRNEKKGNAIAKKIEQRYKVSTDFIKADISSINDVKMLVNQIRNRYDYINVLINNAGATFYKSKKSKDGYELTFATNYLGHFLLTLSLFELLQKADNARIINVSSSAHKNASTDLSDITSPKSYDRKIAYGNSKFAMILFTYELSKKLKDLKINVYAINPGGVATNLGKNNGVYAWFKHYIYHLYNRKLISPQESSEAMVYLSTSKEVENISGKYFYKKEIVKSSYESYNSLLAEELWNLSIKLCKLDENLLFYK